MSVKEGSDFDDDEDFGLNGAAGEDAKPTLGVSEPAAQVQEDDDDIYGDIAGPSAVLPLSGDVTTKASNLKQEYAVVKAEGSAATRAQQQAERQSSGQLAESRGSAPPEPAKRAGKSAPPTRGADTTFVYIGELEWWTSDADLEAACRECGPIRDVTFFEDKGSGKSKGYALVSFESKEAANLCRQVVNGTQINGRKCVVTLSNNSPAATAAAKAGGKPDIRAQHNIVQGQKRGQQQSRQQMGWGGVSQLPEMGRPMMPPMPPWPAAQMMGLGMARMGGMPMMRGMAMRPYMQVADARTNGGDNGREFKRKRY